MAKMLIYLFSKECLYGATFDVTYGDGHHVDLKVLLDRDAPDRRALTAEEAQHPLARHGHVRAHLSGQQHLAVGLVGQQVSHAHVAQFK